tara:strand:- start:5665 stop:6570 length:906 start_codon:yes stop_codon:yes gene_type:complete
MYGGIIPQAFNMVEELSYLLKSNNSSHTRYLSSPHLMEETKYEKEHKKLVEMADVAAYNDGHLPYAAYSSKTYDETKHLAAVMLVQYAGKRSWVTGIREFCQLGIDVSQALVVRLAIVAESYKGDGIFTNMLLDLERYKKAKQYCLAKVSINDVASIKSLFKAGYIIRYVCEDLEHFIMFKNFTWSDGLNPLTYSYTDEQEYTMCQQRKAMEQGEQIQSSEIIPTIDDLYDIINSTGFLVGRKAYVNANFIDSHNLDAIACSISNGYYPLALKDGKFECRKVQDVPLTKEQRQQQEQQNVA